MTRAVTTAALLGAATLLIAADQPRQLLKARPTPTAAAQLTPTATIVKPLTITAVTASHPVPAINPRPAHRSRKRHRSSRALTGVAVADRAATIEPAAAGYVNAAQIYPYSENVVYRAYTAPERITDIALQPGETLSSVAAGDTARWVIGDTTSGGSGSGAGETKRTHVLVKPFAAGLSTNVVIATDRRSYHLSLISTAGAAMTAISWTYPQDALIALAAREAKAEAVAPVAQGLQVDQLRFGYTISGDSPTWRPLRAFDDGRQTFIEFPATLGTGEAPPLFVLGPKNEAELVNYRVRGRFYVVDRLFGAAELRLGTKHQDIVRITRDEAAEAAHGRRAS